MIKMKYSLVVFCTLFAGFFATPVHADNKAKNLQITGEALRAVFDQTMMVGEYRNFRDVTKTYNYTEYHFSDGVTDYIEGKKQEKGIWKIVGDDKICYKYPKSNYYTQTYCFIVYLSDTCYYKYSVRDMTLRGPRSWNRWTSRAIRKGDGGACAEPIS